MSAESNLRDLRVSAPTQRVDRRHHARDLHVSSAVAINDNGRNFMINPYHHLRSCGNTVNIIPVRITVLDSKLFLFKKVARKLRGTREKL